MNSLRARRSGLVLHTVAFVSGGLTMSALLSSSPISPASTSLYTLATTRPSHDSTPSSSLVSPSSGLSLASSTDPLSSPPSSASAQSQHATSSPTPVVEEKEEEAVASIQPKYTFSTPHFALGDLPLFAKAKVRLGELFTGLRDEEWKHTDVALGISLQLRRSPKTVDEIEEERYWQESEEEEEEEW